MANLTISVDEEVLKRARIRALEENTSVNAVLGRFLKEYARLEEIRRSRLAALDRLLKIADESPIDRGGKRWSRDELYDR
jgi:plasmid stability protein